MPFTQLGFNCARQCASPSASKFNNIRHTYTANDSTAAIFTPGYFPSNFGITGPHPITNDLMDIVANDGTANAIITNAGTGAVSQIVLSNPFNQTLDTTSDVTFNSVTFPSTGGPGASALNFYVEAAPLTLTCTGFSGFPAPTVSALATRIGASVILSIQQIDGTSNGSNIIITLPDWLALPVDTNQVPGLLTDYILTDHNMGNLCKVVLDNDDINLITIYPLLNNSSASFPSGSSILINDFVFIYNIA